MPASPLRRLTEWLFHHRGREANPVRLTQRRIFLLPTRYGFLFAIVLLVMLGGSINYSLSLGFVLTFLLGSMAMLSIVHAFRNLSGLEISVNPVGRVFAGESARFEVTLANPRRLPRFSIGVVQTAIATGSAMPHSGAPQSTDCPGLATGRCLLRIPALTRGRLYPGRLTVFTRYPLGMFYAWAHVEPDRFAIVFPRPESTLTPIPASGAGNGRHSAATAGQDDFAGLRPWHAGDSPQRIAWKAVARGQGLLTKQFAGEAGAQIWLDWDLLPQSLGDEGRLSRLARWVLEADNSGAAFGLRIPGRTLPIASGEGHRETALAALALHEARQ